MFKIFSKLKIFLCLLSSFVLMISHSVHSEEVLTFSDTGRYFTESEKEEFHKNFNQMFFDEKFVTETTSVRRHFFWRQFITSDVYDSQRYYEGISESEFQEYRTDIEDIVNKMLFDGYLSQKDLRSLTELSDDDEEKLEEKIEEFSDCVECHEILETGTWNIPGFSINAITSYPKERRRCQRKFELFDKCEIKVSELESGLLSERVFSLADEENRSTLMKSTLDLLLSKLQTKSPAGDFESCNQIRCEQGLVCNRAPNEEGTFPEITQSCSKHSDCESGVCSSGHWSYESPGGFCEPTRNCYSPIEREGVSCLVNPVCAEGLNCRAENIGVPLCHEPGGTCSEDIDCCSGSCNDGTCENKRICTGCVEFGQKAEGRSECCSGLVKDPKSSICVQMIPRQMYSKTTNIDVGDKELESAIDFKTCEFDWYQVYLNLIQRDEEFLSRELSSISLEFIAGGEKTLEDFWGVNTALNDLAYLRRTNRKALVQVLNSNPENRIEIFREMMEFVYDQDRIELESRRSLINQTLELTQNMNNYENICHRLREGYSIDEPLSHEEAMWLMNEITLLEADFVKLVYNTNLSPTFHAIHEISEKLREVQWSGVDRMREFDDRESVSRRKMQRSLMRGIASEEQVFNKHAGALSLRDPLFEYFRHENYIDIEATDHLEDYFNRSEDVIIPAQEIAIFEDLSEKVFTGVWSSNKPYVEYWGQILESDDLKAIDDDSKTCIEGECFTKLRGENDGAYPQTPDVHVQSVITWPESDCSDSVSVAGARSACIQRLSLYNFNNNIEAIIDPPVPYGFTHRDIFGTETRTTTRSRRFGRTRTRTIQRLPGNYIEKVNEGAERARSHLQLKNFDEEHLGNFYDQAVALSTPDFDFSRNFFDSDFKDQMVDELEEYFLQEFPGLVVSDEYFNNWVDYTYNFHFIFPNLAASPNSYGYPKRALTPYIIALQEMLSQSLEVKEDLNDNYIQRSNVITTAASSYSNMAVGVHENEEELEENEALARAVASFEEETETSSRGAQSMSHARTSDFDRTESETARQDSGDGLEEGEELGESTNAESSAISSTFEANRERNNQIRQQIMSDDEKMRESFEESGGDVEMYEDYYAGLNSAMSSVGSAQPSSDNLVASIGSFGAPEKSRPDFSPSEDDFNEQGHQSSGSSGRSYERNRSRRSSTQGRSSSRRGRSSNRGSTTAQQTERSASSSEVSDVSYSQGVPSSLDEPRAVLRESAAAVERNRKRYQSRESDDLFKTISNTYQLNYRRLVEPEQN